MTDQDSDRQILELQLRLRDERMTHIAATFELKLIAAERALQLQAAEYERRLSDLNHAHAKAVEVQDTYVPREVFEEQGRNWMQKRDEDLKWRDEINMKFSRREGGVAAADKGRQQSNWVIGVVIASGVNLIGLIGTWLFYFMTRN